MEIELSTANLAALPSNVAAPASDRSNLKAGILHIGIGNFHRAHQAVYLDDLFNLGVDLDWAVIAAGVRDTDEIGNSCWSSTYWMVGWPPGGSAGTSFCSGAEMSISFRGMALPRCCDGSI